VPNDTTAAPLGASRKANMPLKKQENEKVLNTLLIEHLPIKEKGIIPDGEIHDPSAAI
jgi:hypothetical protein